jgi:predicted transcriptional regulator
MSRKGELYGLVSELRAARVRQNRIAELLGITGARVSQVIADLEGRPAANLGPYLLERCRVFKKLSESPAKK